MPQVINEFREFLKDQQDSLKTRIKTPLYDSMGMSPQTTIGWVFDFLDTELRIKFEDASQGVAEVMADMEYQRQKEEGIE